MQSRDPFAASAFPLKVNHLNKLFTYLSMYSEYLLAQKSRNRVEGLEECRYEHEHLDDGIVWQIPPIRQGKNPFPDTGEVRKCWNHLQFFFVLVNILPQGWLGANSLEQHHMRKLETKADYSHCWKCLHVPATRHSLLECLRSKQWSIFFPCFSCRLQRKFSVDRDVQCKL